MAALAYAPVLALSLLGAAVSLWSRREGLLLFAVPVLFALGYSLFHTTVRYRIPTEPCSMLLASYGLFWTLSRVYQSAASSSSSSSRILSSHARASNATIRLIGNGHGCDPR